MTVRSILVVDDCDLAQMVAAVEIERFDPNIEVACAFDGLEALDMLDSGTQAPDVILLDLNMPRMNGHEFLAAYSAREGARAAIAVISSSSLEEDRARASRHECMRYFFGKPLTQDHLEQIREGERTRGPRAANA